MKVTGHKTESVYNRYAIVSDADLPDATIRLTRGALPDLVRFASEREGVKVET
jgi:hypothetical protein